MNPALEIVRIPALDDNYIWLISSHASGEAVVIDPGVAPPVHAAARERAWTIVQSWNTRWHADHIGGNAAIGAATGAFIVTPRREAHRIPLIDRVVGEGGRVEAGAIGATVWDVPGHALGHVAYHFEDAGSTFVGDTPFAMGCGRLFEGTGHQMRTNMRRFAALPDATAVYCAHEYTLANGRFASAVQPNNGDVAARLREVERMRSDGLATVPTTIGVEKRTNPFMRAGSVEVLLERWLAKDAFA